MSLFRNILSRRFHTLLNPQNPHTLHYSLKFPHRPITSLPQTQDPVAPKPQFKQNKKPLHALFTEAVGLSQKTTTINEEEEEETELKKELKQLEEEVRSFKEKTKGVPKNAERKSLVSLFTNQPANARARTEKKVKVREPMVFKELSPDMELFVQHLYDNGYFKDANFAKGKQKFDPAWFESFFARGYIKFAAQKFARDNREIAKWLSGSALKQVAVFGCPSIDKGSVFPAKRLRNFFEVQENTVCSECMMRHSCNFVNQSVWKCDTNNLDLEEVMKVIISYALELVHPKLVVPDQVNKSISQLLKEVVKQSQIA
ncbi:uncharacterized protein LOC133296405 isoform X1 [Gastrolobium bilobum]|uniref:uncharacterized protein LOC133296405 isoform X1 n=1 Tax=Gastrolobium bilobum TaxID=150636 RepID=UPI002AB2CACA|nr:uncharacterized protein LOC133296405 isoform X1 [Gastrolobium bilobum]